MRINILNVLFKIYFRWFKTEKKSDSTSDICMSESESLLCDEIRIWMTQIRLWVAVPHLVNVLPHFTATVHPPCLGDMSPQLPHETPLKDTFYIYSLRVSYMHKRYFDHISPPFPTNSYQTLHISLSTSGSFFINPLSLVSAATMYMGLGSSIGT